MKVQNMTSSRGSSVPNQFILTGTFNGGQELGILPDANVFQSYDSTIVVIHQGTVYLDSHYWDYSITTGKYRNQFLGENKAETQKKIDSGEYKLVNLN